MVRLGAQLWEFTVSVRATELTGLKHNIADGRHIQTRSDHKVHKLVDENLLIEHLHHHHRKETRRRRVSMQHWWTFTTDVASSLTGWYLGSRRQNSSELISQMPRSTWDRMDVKRPFLNRRFFIWITNRIAANERRKVVANVSRKKKNADKLFSCSARCLIGRLLIRPRCRWNQFGTEKFL